MMLLEKEWFIQAPWGRLCIVAWGDCCDPPVLVCHGNKDSIASFRPLIQLLPKNFYYIGMEIPGSGKSDPMLPGLMINLYDLVYSVQLIVKHFRWETFMFMGHSLGSSMGFIYNLSYPGRITKVIQLDPLSIGFTVPPHNFPKWYNKYFTRYFDNYEKNTGGKELKPTYTREEAVAKIINRRGFTKQLAEETLDRVSEPAGEGLIRFTFDDRTDLLTFPPISSEHMKELLTGIKSSILMIIPEDTKKAYARTSFVFDEKAFPHNNYRVRTVEGNHDVHAIHPERVAPFIAQFLLHGIEGLDNKAKL